MASSEGEFSRLLRKSSLFLWLRAEEGKLKRRNFGASAQIFSVPAAPGRDKQVQKEQFQGFCANLLCSCGSRRKKASSKGEFSGFPRRNSLFWRRRERSAAAGKEKIAGFWRKFLPLPGAGSVALWQEREDCRILKKISPFERRPERGVGAGKRRLQDFEEDFSF